MRVSSWAAAGAALSLFLACSAPALAYIGPGAGISFVGSLLTTLIVSLLTVAAVLFWPVRYLLRRWRKPSAARAQEDSPSS